jgi:hypothetical protein
MMSDNLLKAPSDALSEADQEIALQSARNPETPSHLLERLSQNKEPEVLRALAKNPNTPQEVLFVVGQKYTQEFLENPIMPLWFLEQPDLVKKMPPLLLLRLLDFTLPEMWLAQIAQHAPRHILQRLASLLSLSTQLLTFIGKQNFFEVDLRVAKHPNTAPETLAWLLASEHEKVRAIALQNVRTPKAFYQLLAKACGDPDLRELTSSTATLTQEELRLLSQHNLFAKTIVAQHSDTTDDVLLLLAESESSQVRRSVAVRPTLPKEILQQLSRDHASEIRAALFQNPSLPEEIVSLLAQDLSREMQLAYLNSAYITREALLTALVTLHSKLYVGDLLPATIERLLQDVTDEQEWLNLAETTPSLQRFLVPHSKSPSALWIRLAKEKGIFRDGFVSMRRLPEEVLWALSENPEHACLLAVTRHPNTPAKLLARLADASFIAIKNTVAAHPNTSEETLAKLSQHPAASVRRAVAQNQNTPTKMLVSLAQEPDVQVKRAALKTLNQKNLLLLLA